MNNNKIHRISVAANTMLGLSVASPYWEGFIIELLSEITKVNMEFDSGDDMNATLTKIRQDGIYPMLMSHSNHGMVDVFALNIGLDQYQRQSYETVIYFGFNTDLKPSIFAYSYANASADEDGDDFEHTQDEDEFMVWTGPMPPEPLDFLDTIEKLLGRYGWDNWKTIQLD